MKCVGIQLVFIVNYNSIYEYLYCKTREHPEYSNNLLLFRYIEAIRRLKKEGRRFKRTIHMTFVPGNTIHSYKVSFR